MSHQTQFQSIHSPHSVPSDALGHSESFLDFQEALSRVAPIERPVLILGERGTGKELAATRLHYLSRRWQGPFVTLNCASLSPTLVEAELFGHEKGAFTGAHRQRKGRFQSADKGTLFLDEIANIPMEVQEKILRVVEYGMFEPVGSAESFVVDVRIISATNADLSQMANEGRFMVDLLDRLSFEVLFVPPLRYRAGDIPLLSNHFASRMALELGWDGDMPVFSPEAMAALEAHPWRGNVRELKNVVERAVYKSDHRVVQSIDFNPFLSPFAVQNQDGKGRQRDGSEDRNELPTERPMGCVDERGDGTADTGCEKREKCDIGTLGSLPLKEAVKILEISMVKRALTETRYQQKEAARFLGLTYDQLRGLLRKYKNEF